MIYAKITPPVLTPVQPNPFDPPAYAEGHYLMATIPNYELGSSQTFARSVYGIPIFNDENILVNWRAFYVENVELGETVMQNWGTKMRKILLLMPRNLSLTPRPQSKKRTRKKNFGY